MMGSLKKEKILTFPRFYDLDAIEKEPIVVDIKAKYPEINFSLLVVSKLYGTTKLSMALDALVLLRQKPGYSKAGLIIVGLRGSTWKWRLYARMRGLSGWVRFEQAHSLASLTSYFKTTNFFLYLAGGEENEDAFVRAAAAHSTIIAIDSKITHALIKDGINGIIITDPTAGAFAQAIVKMNEGPEREIFRVNSSLYMAQTVVATHQEIVATLQALWDFEEAPTMAETGEMPHLNPHPLMQIQKQSRIQKIKEVWKEMFPPKNTI